MKQHLSTRVLLAVSFAVLGTIGSLVAADRSAITSVIQFS